MYQVVVYLRQTRSDKVYQNVFELAQTHHEFGVIRLWEQPTELFLGSPGLLPFAVLSATEDRVAVLRRVAAIADRCQRSDVAVSTAVLAGLVLTVIDY